MRKITARVLLTLAFGLLGVSMIVVPAVLWHLVDSSTRAYLWLFVMPAMFNFFMTFLSAANLLHWGRMRGESETMLTPVSRQGSRTYSAHYSEFEVNPGLRYGVNEGFFCDPLRPEVPERRARTDPSGISSSDVNPPIASSQSKVSSSRLDRSVAQTSDVSYYASCRSTNTASAKELEGSSQEQPLEECPSLEDSYEVDVGSNYTDSQLGEVTVADYDFPIYGLAPKLIRTPVSDEEKKKSRRRPWKSLEKRRTMPKNLDYNTELQKSMTWPPDFKKALLEVKRSMDMPLVIAGQEEESQLRRQTSRDSQKSSREKVKSWLMESQQCSSKGGLTEPGPSKVETKPKESTSQESVKSDKDRPNRFFILGRGYFYAIESDDYVRVEPEDEMKSGSSPGAPAQAIESKEKCETSSSDEATIQLDDEVKQS